MNLNKRLDAIEQTLRQRQTRCSHCAGLPEVPVVYAEHDDGRVSVEQFRCGCGWEPITVIKVSYDR